MSKRVIGDSRGALTILRANSTQTDCCVAFLTAMVHNGTVKPGSSCTGIPAPGEGRDVSISSDSGDEKIQEAQG